MSSLKQESLKYAELGYPVFPLAPATKTPITDNGCLDATTDFDKINGWWTKRPNANVGIATAGLLVLDLDDGHNWLSNDPDKLHDLTSAPLSLTANNGRQYVFRQPTGKNWRNTAGRLAMHVDTRADGGYIVVPPSVLEGQRAYRWSPGMELDCRPDELPEPPAWLIAELDALVTEGGGTDSSAVIVGNMIPSGQRNETLARLAGNMRRVGMSQSEIFAALERTNAERCSPPIDRSEVQRVAESVARYEPDQIAVAIAENHWAQIFERPEDNQRLTDPGPIPETLLRIPGFVSEVMDFCLETAPYPNTVMAFSGAIALLSFLSGRKVRDPGDNRTNLYLLGLAHSAAGKDWPRKINTRILHEVGLTDGLGERFASGEGIQDALFLRPSMLFQTDEIDGMLQSINKSRDARHENIMSTLLTLYSSANSVFPMRRKAGKESPGSIDQPCLTVFGTAIPNHYYEALSDRMLTNGFFARMLILESGRRQTGQEPRVQPIPERILQTANYWKDYQPGTGNLESWHPVPTIISHTSDAQDMLVEARQTAEFEYEQAEQDNDIVGTTVWGRVSEQTRKLALLYAISVDHENPLIDKIAIAWAVKFVMHQTRRMLFMAQSHVADNPFHAECLKFMQNLSDEPGKCLSHSKLLKRMKMDSKSFREIISTLMERGDIEMIQHKTTGRTGIEYRIVGG